MPRKSRGAPRTRHARGPARVIISGSVALTGTIANGNNSVTLALTPSALPPLSNVCKGYEFFKFRRLQYCVQPVTRMETTWPATSAAARWAVGYLPEQTNATTTSIPATGVMTLPNSVTGMASVVNVSSSDESGTNTGKLLLPGNTVDKTLRVRGRELNDSLAKMFRTQSATTGDPATVQGTLIWSVDDAAGANTVKIQGILRYTIEFFSFVDATVLTLRGIPSTDEEKSQCEFEELHPMSDRGDGRAAVNRPSLPPVVGKRR